MKTQLDPINWKERNIVINLLSYVDLIKTGKIIIRGWFQRKSVWPQGLKKNLIKKSINHEFMSRIIIAYVKGIGFVIVDGQQRSLTFHDYTLNDVTFLNIPSFKNLSKEDQEKLLNFEIHIDYIGECTEEEVKKIFKDLNQGQVKLNTTEILYSEFSNSSEFMKKSIKLCDKHNTFFEETLKTSGTSRMKDLAIVLNAAATIDTKEYFHYLYSPVPTLLAASDYNNNGIDIIDNIISHLAKYKSFLKSMFTNKTQLFTLIVEMSKLPMIPENFEQILIRFTKLYKIRKQFPLDSMIGIDLNNYHMFSNGCTDSLKHRQQRGEILNRNLNIDILTMES
jgi:hypothetical protein